jgi:hypothetical protein
MSENLLLERLQLETELLEGRTAEQTDPNLVVDLALLCQEIPAHARMSRESLFRRLVKTRQADKLEEEGQLFLTCVRQALKAMSELAAVFGVPFHQIQAELEQIEQEHLDRWPWVRKEDLDQARAEAARGETVDVEDAFAAMAGVSREEWETRVEAYQRRKQSQEGK